MTSRSVSLLFLAAISCSSPPPAPPPKAPPPLPGRAPLSPPGTEDLRAAPCASKIDVSIASAQRRAFDPGARPLSARTELPFRLRDATSPAAWSSSRPSALRFEQSAPDTITLIAGEPGATLVRLAVNGEEATALVSVPLFVRVRADADFGAMLAEKLGLTGRERALMSEAERAFEAIYSGVNVRVAFQTGLGEEIPKEISNDGFIDVTLHGDLHRCVTPRSSLLHTEFGGYAEGDGTRRLDRSPVHLCPAIFVRHPDTMAALVKNRARLLADADSASLYVTILGRALGELLAHEIGHQLLGCDNRGERRYWRCHDRLPHSLMNKAGERSFADRTGIVIRPTQYSSWWRDDFPAPGTYEDLGLEAINRLPPDGQAVLDRILPVPPVLREEHVCP